MKTHHSISGRIAAFATVGLAATMALMGPVAALAQDATPAGGPPAFTPPNGCVVYADGLFNPRYIAFDESDNLYVSEAGDAGDEAHLPPAGEGTPEATEPLSFSGPSGQVTVVSADGTTSVLAGGLPSYTFGSEVVGAAGIDVSDGKVYLAIGGPGPATALIPPAQYRDTVISIDIATGEIVQLADIGDYERTTNPDPNAVDSNLYGLVVGTDGSIYVSDAGGNAVYKIDPATNELSVLAIIPGVPVDGFQNPSRGGAAEIDPVPTGLAAAPDGGVYVGLLTGGPFPPGASTLLHVAPDGAISEIAPGLTMVTGVAVSPAGDTYAVQISEDFLSTPPAAGSIVRIAEDGTFQSVVPGLPIPNDVAFDSAGNLYAVVMTTAPAGTPPGGLIIKCEASALGGEATPDTASTGGAIEIAVADLSFEPKAFSIVGGDSMVLHIVNNGVLPHNFTIDALDLHTGTISAGEAVDITISAAAGEYTFYCSIPGHKEAGMIGTLTVS